MNRAPAQTNQLRKNKRLLLGGRPLQYKRGQEDEFQEGSLFTLSQSGLFVQTPHIPETGSSVEIHFKFCKREIRCLGKVIYVYRVGDGFRPQGFGIKFQRMQEMDYEMIKREIDFFYSGLSNKSFW